MSPSPPQEGIRLKSRGRDELLVRYLLGDLPEKEQTELERRYFGDDELFDRVLATDGDLAAAYLNAELSTGEREAFERRLLCSPRGREKVEFAAAKKRLALEGPRPAPIVPKPFPAFWRATAVLFLSVACILLALRSLSWREERARSESDRLALKQEVARLEQELQGQRARADQLLQEREKLSGELAFRGAEATVLPAGPRSLSFLIAPGSPPDIPESNRLVIPGDTEVVFLQLALEEGASRPNQAVIERITGERLWEQSRLEPRASKDDRTVLLTMAASFFTPGDYIVRLRSETPQGRFQTVGSYHVQIARK
jgi:hypothetical protein